MKKFTFIIAVMFSVIAISQVTNEGTPLSWDLNIEKSMDYISLPEIDLNKLVEEDLVRDKQPGVPYRIGVPLEAQYDISNSGSWSNLDNGDRIWRIAFHSKDAIQISVNFDKFKIPEGASLYLYNESKTDLLGAYTSIQNQKSGVLGTWFVQGDSLWIEYYEPKEVIGQGELSIENIIHCYRGAGKHQSIERQEKINESGDCNHDVECPIGADWEAHKELNKKGAAFLNMGNGFICSGTLINNTSQDYTPYFLTADHCYDGSNPNIWSMRFKWISPNPSCATTTGSTNGPTYMTISGATLRANNVTTDVCLVEINNNPPQAWNLTWAGWDNTDAYPDFVVGIHHPAGDIMKISRDDDSPFKQTVNGKPAWVIDHNHGGWDIGVTEGGSSGSALFDEDGRIIGQLWAGTSECVGTDDNDGYDLYGRFAVSWDGVSSAVRLKDWLDPTNTGLDVIDAYSASAAVDEYLDESIVVYPNPTTGIINVSVKNFSGSLNYSISSIMGQQLAAGEVENSNLKIDLGDASDGVYLLKLADKDSQKYIIKKIIVRK